MARIDTKNLDFDSKVIHAGAHTDAYGSATVPIYQTSTFAFHNAQQGADRFAGTADGFIYTRLGNPTTNALERQMAELENGFGGIATSSGMGAVSTVYMALLDKGSHIAGTAGVYGPSRLLAEKHLSRFGVESTWVDTTDLGPASPGHAAQHPHGVCGEPVESEHGCDRHLRAAAEIAHAAAARCSWWTTPSPARTCRSRSISAPTWSCTRSPSSSTATPTWSAASSSPRPRRCTGSSGRMMTTLGCNMDPHQAYLVIRGLKTLAVRAGTGPGQRHQDRQVARGTAAGRVGALRRADVASATRAGQAADERLWRDDRLRAARGA